jgi:hypothetical protein
MTSFLDLYEKEKYWLDFNETLKDGTKNSDRLYFKNRKEALDVLNNERAGTSGIAYDEIEDLFYFNDDDTFTVIWNGKLTKKKFK